MPSISRALPAGCGEFLRSRYVYPRHDFSKGGGVSTVEVIEGQGPSGSELYLQEEGARVAATLRDYFGNAEPLETRLRGTLIESPQTGDGLPTCRLKLSGTGKSGRVEVEGEITLLFFHGTVTRHLGKNVLSHRISLKRRLPPDDNRVGALVIGSEAPSRIREVDAAFAPPGSVWQGDERRQAAPPPHFRVLS